jgi:hypothetical protein
MIKMKIEKFFVVVRGTVLLTLLAPPFGAGSILPIVTIMWVSVSSELYLRFWLVLTFGVFTFFLLKRASQRRDKFLGVG